VRKGDAAAAVERAALDDGVAVELPALVALLGKEDVAAGAELEVLAHGHARLPAQTPGVILEVTARARAGRDALEERLLARPASLCVHRGWNGRQQQSHEREGTPHGHQVSGRESA
jgi:hypothetical protein